MHLVLQPCRYQLAERGRDEIGSSSESESMNECT